MMYSHTALKTIDINIIFPCLTYWRLIEKVNYILTVYHCEAFSPSEGQSRLFTIESPATEKFKKEKEEE